MLKNIIRVLISNVVVMFTSFINTLIIPKILSIDDFAQYQTFMLYVSYISIMTLGFHAGMFVKYGGIKQEEVDIKQFKSEMSLVLLSQIIISAIVVMVSILLKDKLLFYTATCILSSNFVSVYKYLYQAWNKFRIFSIINIIQSLGFSGLVLFLGLYFGKIEYTEIILVYIIINAICFIYIFISYWKSTSGIKRNAILSIENKRIFQIGFLLILGGAANVVLSSIDKYYIKILFSNYDFSMYSFAITLLNVMNVFISAIAQPMYLQLAQNLDDDSGKKYYKEILFCFGALSGCAYYAVAVIVKIFIPEYLDSLKIVAILFAIFPSVAIINCLYINLYKATNQIKKYILTLTGMIVCAAVFNGIAIMLYKNPISIAFATTLCYYVWLFVSSRHFKGLNLLKKDVKFLLGFSLIYFGITMIDNVIIGFIIYLIVILIWEFIVYRESILKIGEFIFSKISYICHFKKQ